MKLKKHKEAEEVTETAKTAAEETPAAELTETEKLVAELAEKDEKIKALTEEAARATADYYNLRTRVERDRERDMKFAAERSVNGLLPVYENLERIFDSVPDKEDNFAKGVSMVIKQFYEVLAGLGLEEIKADGKFDPSLHEAVMMEPVDEEEMDGTVLSVFRKGYSLAGRVLRAAQVKVGRYEKA